MHAGVDMKPAAVIVAARGRRGTCRGHLSAEALGHSHPSCHSDDSAISSPLPHSIYRYLAKISSGWHRCGNGLALRRGDRPFKLRGRWLVGLFRSHAAHDAEIMFLRQQLLVPPSLRLRTADRLIFDWLYRLFTCLLGAAVIFKPDTLVQSAGERDMASVRRFLTTKPRFRVNGEERGCTTGGP